MNKEDKFIKELKEQSEFVKVYLGEEDVWILLKSVEVDSTHKYNQIAKKYSISKNILLLNDCDEKMLIEDLGDDKKKFKIISNK